MLPDIQPGNTKILYFFNCLLDGMHTTKQKFGELLIQHEVRVLMTRGVNGVYIYACDEQLREALNKAEG